MSENYKDAKELPTEVLCRRLDQLSDAVTEGRESVLREFVMRVPAEVDHDADIVLAEAARRLRSHNAQRTEPFGGVDSCDNSNEESL